ncbi:hypothetical protein SAMN04488082_12046 [Desulfomicrobium apsheronum]|jgi:hypothetical protein|uniref:Uncharacterized protein n=1 Tax=Desulfomicrobium apsheronum TaxID=52560 RepID=A0A1I3YJ18_9BACT|nr:hypothetical protein [Desulfomicrobium apsheronum]SFK31878.1 hypothetical protein SAMN04488082_12046 [Desulfomicrobium apsheronum]
MSVQVQFSFDVVIGRGWEARLRCEMSTGPSRLISPKAARRSASAAKARLMELAEEIIAVLGQDPNAEIRVNLEIHADYPNGASDQIKRAVTLWTGLKTAEREG